MAIKVGFEIEFLTNNSQRILEIASDNNIIITDRTEKKVTFNEDGIGLTKEYYIYMYELNIEFTDNIDKLIEKIKKGVKLFNITYPRFLNKQGIPPVGCHIHLLFEEQNYKKLLEMRWRMMYYIAAIWQFILSGWMTEWKAMNANEKELIEHEVYRFLRSHHLNAYYVWNLTGMHEIEKIYSSINGVYAPTFKNDNMVYKPVTIKSKNINGKNMYTLELRAIPWYSFFLKEGMIEKIFEFTKKKITKKKAIAFYNAVYINAAYFYGSMIKRDNQYCTAHLLAYNI